MSPTRSDLIDLKPGEWTIDPVYSEVGFTIRHLMTKIRGSFTTFRGTITIAEPLAASTVDVEIDVASLDTHNATRDKHVLTPEILAAEKYRVLRFVSNRLHVESGSATLYGDLTVKDTAREIALAVEFNGVSSDPWGGTRAGFSATTTISRRDFGVEWDVPLQGDRALLGDRVDITIEIQTVLHCRSRDTSRLTPP